MSTRRYTTMQQHIPLTKPTSWNFEEARVLQQIEEIFDDIYRRFNRLRMLDLGDEVTGAIAANTAAAEDASEAAANAVETANAAAQTVNDNLAYIRALSECGVTPEELAEAIHQLIGG